MLDRPETAVDDNDDVDVDNNDGYGDDDDVDNNDGYGDVGD